MIHVLHSLLDIVFPPRETEKQLREATALPYQPGTHEGVLFLSEYANNYIRAAITENKFHQNQKAARLLSVLCVQWLQSRSDTIVWIPVPLGRARQKTRGYNQVETVLGRIPKAAIVRALERTKETSPQVGHERLARLKNVHGAFSFANTPLSANTTYVLVDDVVTTGATLKAARASLAPHLPSSSKLICLALAH